MFEQPPFFRKHEINEVKRFIEQQNNAFGYGSITKLSHSQSPTPCRGCQQLMNFGAACIYIKRADYTSLWHPQCFTCTECKEFLDNLTYFYKDGQLYCERHHAELYKPQYTGCDQIIFGFECIEAEGYGWNICHFFCSNCKERLDGEHYIMRKCQSFCLNCFETMYPEHCDTCCERIEADQAQITHESHQWHATETCFCCYACLIPLNNSGFLQDYGALFCSNECASQRNNHSINTKLIQQNKFHQDLDIIPTSYIHTNHHVETKSHSHESIQFYNDLNLEKVDRHGVTLEIPRCSTSISSSASLAYQAPSNRFKSFRSNGIMSVISRPKSIITSQFPRSSSLNGSSRFTKQYRVHFVDDEKEKNSKYSPTMSYKSKSLCRSSSVDDNNQDDFNSIYGQFDKNGNRLRKPINCTKKISYVDETSTINPKLMKKTTTLNKKQKKSNEERRKKDGIISLSFFCIFSKSLH